MAIKAQRKTLWKLGIAFGVLVIFLFFYSMIRDLPKHIVVTPGPWEALHPGSPTVAPLKIRILKEGVGQKVELGDLVQVRVSTVTPDRSAKVDLGEWWVWIAFRNSKDTPFFSQDESITSSLVGLAQGTTFEFAETRMHGGKEEILVGELHRNPIGDSDTYGWRTQDRRFINLSLPRPTSGTTLTIERTCKANVETRLTRVHDDGPFRRHSEYKSWIVYEQQEIWVVDARITARCKDGGIATFHFGPVAAPGKEDRVLAMGYFDDWLSQAWKTLPVGVQLK